MLTEAVFVVVVVVVVFAHTRYTNFDPELVHEGGPHVLNWYIILHYCRVSSYSTLFSTQRRFISN